MNSEIKYSLAVKTQPWIIAHSHSFAFTRTPARKFLRPQTATSIVAKFLDFDVFLNGVGVLIAIDQTAVGGNVDALELEFYALDTSPTPPFFNISDTYVIYAKFTLKRNKYSRIYMHGKKYKYITVPTLINTPVKKCRCGYGGKAVGTYGRETLTNMLVSNRPVNFNTGTRHRRGNSKCCQKSYIY